MKKYLKSIICLILITLLSFSTAMANEEVMQADWYGDYSTMELVVTVKAPTDYIQNVTVVMFPKGAEESFATYSRVDEITLNGKEEKTVRFKITDDLAAPDGIYTVKLQGNGSYDPLKNSAEIDVCIMPPNSVNRLLDEINAVTDSTEGINALKGYMSDVSEILQLEGVSEASDIRIGAIISIRDNDFLSNNKKFASLNDVEKAWRASKLLEYLSKETISAEGLETEYVKISDILSVEMTDEDYTDRKTDVYTNIIGMRNLYNDGAGVKSIANAEDVFSKAKAVAFINAATVDTLNESLSRYITTLGVDNEVYSDFCELSTENQKKVLRQLVNKSFKTSEAVASAFNLAMSGLEESSGGGGGGGGGSSAGGSFGGSGAGVGNLGGVSSEAVQPLPENPTQSDSFSDLGNSHWAYSYISDLKETGIISGYSDGKFYPENAVKREEFVKMIILAADMYSETSECEFDDVSVDSWCFKYVASATSKGIINGIGDGNFGVGRNISREDVAVIVDRILNKMEIYPVSEEVKAFSDSVAISSYATESVNKLASMGILNGFEDGSFNPKGNLTRAEAAKIISVITEYIKK